MPLATPAHWDNPQRRALIQGALRIRRLARAYIALPEDTPKGLTPALLTLGLFEMPENLAALKEARRDALRLCHPDSGTYPNVEKTIAVNNAYDAVLRWCPIPLDLAPA